MKNFIRNNLFGFLIGMILCSGIVYAASLYYAKDVTYDPIDASWEVNNINDALDDLYKIQSTRPKVIKDYFSKSSYVAEKVASANMNVIFDCSNVKTVTLNTVSIMSGTLSVYGILEDGSAEQLYSITAANTATKKVDLVNITKYNPEKHKKIRIHFSSPLEYINMNVSGYIERIY